METIRYGLVGKQDCKIGFGAFQVTLANGQVVMLDELDIAYLTGDAYTEANLPATTEGIGRVARVTDGAKGLWTLGPNAAWYAVNGECVNVLDYATLAAAIADISTTQRTLIIPRSVTVSANLTIPANVTLWFTNQGKISVNSAITLSMNGLILAPRRQIFAGSGTVDFGDGSTGTAYPEWFGAVVDGSTDDTSIVQTTVSAMSTGFGGIVEISPDTSWTPGSVTIPANVLVMDYSDPDAPTWRTNTSTRAMMENLDGAGLILNGKLAVTVSANAITVALKTKAGNDPSAADPVKIAFRSATLTDGGYVFRSVTGALSMTVSATSTLGFTSALTSRIYVVALDNAGTVELGVYHPLDPSTLSLIGINESNLVSSTAEGGAGGADGAQSIYSTTARSNVACRVLGYFEIQSGATAGNWSNAPTVIQLMGPGVHRTGQVVQSVYSSTGTGATGTTQIPSDNTIPQNTEGDQYMTKAVTPTSALNLLKIETLANLGSAVGGSQDITLALFQDSTANAIAAVQGSATASGLHVPLRLRHVMRAGTASATTLKARAGANGAGTTSFNGVSGTQSMGGVLESFISIDEVFV